MKAAYYQRSNSPPRKQGSGRSQSKQGPVEPYQLQPTTLHQVKLIPDRSTDQLRMHAHGANLVNARLSQSKLQGQKPKQIGESGQKTRHAIAIMDVPGLKPETNENNNEFNVNTFGIGMANKGEKLASGFVRSKRNLAMMPDNSVQDKVMKLEEEKLALIKRLNDQLVRLDRLNEDKRKMHDSLLESIKFVRDLHKATGGSGQDDLNSMVSQEVRLAYKNEQNVHKQLEAELLQADQDRSQLLDRIKHIHSGKELLKQQDQTNHHTQANCNLNRLIKDIDNLKHEVHSCEHEISKLTKTLLLRKDHSCPDLRDQERAIAVLTHETSLLEARTEEMVQRKAHAMRSLGTEQGRIVRLNQHTAKLLCTKSLVASLQRVVLRQYQGSFQQLWLVNNTQQVQTLRLCALIKNFKTINSKVLRAAMQTWYARAYEPKQTYKMNRDLPGFYQRKDLGHLELNKYKIEISQKVCDKTRFQSVGNTIKHTTSQWQIRLVFSALKHWHRVTHPKATAIKLIARNISKFNMHQKSTSLHQWLNFVHERRLIIRLHALPIKIACKQLEKRVFIALRAYALNRSLRKRSRILRAFKNLKVACERSRLGQDLEKLVVKMQGECSEAIRQACWSEINYQKEVQVVDQAKEQLTNITPTITSLHETNTQLTSVKQSKSLRRAVHALVITPFSKQLSQILQIWQKSAQSQTTRFQHVMKRLLQKVFKSKLRLAYDRLKLKQGLAIKIKDHSKIDSLHKSNVQVQNANYELRFKVESEASRIKNMASKHLRRLCEQAFDRNLEYWLCKWSKGCDLLERRQQGLARVVKKIRKSLLMQVMYRYKRGCSFRDQDDYNTKRVREVSGRLKTRTKKRVYQAIRDFAQLHVERTRCLKYLFKMTDRHNMVRGMLMWQRYARGHREDQLLRSEKVLVKRLDVVQQEVSQVSDTYNSRDIDTKRLQGILTLEAKITLQKWLERFCMGGLQYGFQTWKQKAQNLKNRVLFLQYSRRHLVLQYLRTAWFRWQEASSNLFINDNQAYQERVQRLTNETTQKIKFHQDQHNSKVQNIIEETEPVLQETKVFSTKAQKVVELMILRRSQNYFVFKQRFILQKWYAHSKGYRRGGKALERGITKLMLQRGWNQVRDSVRDQILQEKRQKFCRKLHRRYKLARLRRYFNNWRDSEYNQEMSEIRELRRETQEQVETQHQLVKNTRCHHSNLINQKNYKLILKQLWNFWHNYAFNKAVKRQETIEMHQEYTAYRARRFLKRWNQRVLIRVKQTAQILKMKERYRKIYEWAVFRNMKCLYIQGKRMANNTLSLMTALKNFHLLVAFKKILWQSQIRNESSKRNRQQSSRMLSEIFNKLRSQNLRHAQSQLKLHVHQGQRLQAILKQWLQIGRVQKVRAYFYKWQFTREKIDVVDLNENQDGPVNLVCWNLRLKCNQLAEMMQYDGAPDELIHYVMYKQKQQFNYLTDKTITRMMIHGDNNLKLLPYCLDKLRSHARVMKRWRSSLQFCNSIVKSETSEVYRAFRQWKEQGFRQKKVLEATPYLTLVEREDKNKIMLVRAADNVEDHVEALEKFREQRDVLFHSFIQGQKLALSLAKHNHERGQQKTLVKLSDHSNGTLQGQIGDSISNNLATIQSLKSRINQMEDENQEISQRNDSYRCEAHTAVRNAKLLQSIQNDNHHLLNQQNDHAANIKRLIEDNFILTKKIQTARVEAKNTLEHQNMLHYQKMMELEQLKREERESASRRAALSGYSQMTSYHQPQRETEGHSQMTSYHQPLRETERSVSPPQIVSPTSGRLRYLKNSSNGKSPLRIRNLSANSQKQQ